MQSSSIPVTTSCKKLYKLAQINFTDMQYCHLFLPQEPPHAYNPQSINRVQDVPHPCVYLPVATMPQHMGQHPLCMELDRVLCMILARAPYDDGCCTSAVELCKAFEARLKACCAGGYGGERVRPGCAGPEKDEFASVKKKSITDKNDLYTMTADINLGDKQKRMASIRSSAGLSMHPADAEIEVLIDVSLTAKIKIYDNKARRLQLLCENWIGGDLDEDVALLCGVTPLPGSDRLDEIVRRDALFTVYFQDNCVEGSDEAVYSYEQVKDLVLRNDVWLEFVATEGDVYSKTSEIKEFLPTLIRHIKSDPVFNANLKFWTENSKQDKIVVCCQDFSPSFENYHDTFMLDAGFRKYKYSSNESTLQDLDEEKTYEKMTIDDNAEYNLVIEPSREKYPYPHMGRPIEIYYYYLQTKNEDKLIDRPEWFNIWLAGHATSHQSACISPLVIDALMLILYEASEASDDFLSPTTEASRQLKSFLNFLKLSPREAIEQLVEIMSVREFVLGNIENWHQNALRHLEHWNSNKVQILPFTEDGIKTANQSVSEHLGGSFDNFLKYSPDQHTVLAATLKVKIMWQIKFYPARMEDFTDIFNSKVQVLMMRSTAPIPKCWQEAETYDMAVIPIQGDNNTEMRVFMPKQNVSLQQVLSEIKKHHLFEDTESGKRKNCYLKIPKFKMTCEDADMANFLSKNTELTNVFQNSQDFAIFQEGSSGFDRVCTMVEFEIHEDGAEVKAAAKATATRGARREEIILDLIFDRPFIAYIVHKSQKRISVASIYTGHLGIKSNHYRSDEEKMVSRGSHYRSDEEKMVSRGSHYRSDEEKMVSRGSKNQGPPANKLSKKLQLSNYDHLDKQTWLEIKIAQCNKTQKIKEGKIVEELDKFEEGKIVEEFDIFKRNDKQKIFVQADEGIRIQIKPIIDGIKKLIQKFDDLNGVTEEQTSTELPAEQNRELMFPVEMDPNEINRFTLEFWLNDASKLQGDAFVDLEIHGIR